MQWRDVRRLAMIAWMGAAAAACATCASAPPATSLTGRNWTGSWSASPQLTEARNLPPAPGLSGNTLRQVVHLSLGGRAVRLRLSNEFGDRAVTVRRARIAMSGGGNTILAGTDHGLTFDGRSSVVIAAGSVVESDPIPVSVGALTNQTVSLYLGDVSAKVTGHPGSRTTSYLAVGEQTSATSLPDAVKVEHWYFLSGIDVLPTHTAAAVVTLGNSITDGRGSGTDLNNRWPDNLARLLQADARTAWVGVLNAGIGGNAVLRGGLGPTALDRLDRDVLAQRGVRWLIVSEGVNDIGAARGAAAAAAVADELIEAFEQIIARSRRAQLRVYGATLTPFGGSQYDDAPREAARQRVNGWIRTSNAFDGVVDFDAAVRDPLAPGRLRRDLDTGDHLHPNEAGYRVMAAAIDRSWFVP